MSKEIDKLQKPPQIAVKFPNMVFVLVILLSILIIVYTLYKIFIPPESVTIIFYIVSILSVVVFAVLSGLGLKN
tara:strand:- start:288 stop:509 length:222 start_codon:yes stop_codon:yes gene_type:complete